MIFSEERKEKEEEKGEKEEEEEEEEEDINQRYITAPVELGRHRLRMLPEHSAMMILRDLIVQ